MGIPGFTKFINDRAQLYYENHDLTDCNLIIDGHSISCQLYNWKHWQFDARSLNCYGGDYDKYVYIVKNFFWMLREVRVKPIVIFDGGFEQRKLPTILKRMQDKLNIAERLTPESETQNPYEVVFPLGLREAFKDILRNLDVEMVMCEYEGDQEIASIAKTLNCPVLTFDSDYYIFGAQYIPFKTLESKVCAVDNWRTGTYKFISCKLYKIEKFLEDFQGLKENTLHLLPVLLGNDYIDQRIFNDFLLMINIDGNVRLQDKIKLVLDWLKTQTPEMAIRSILKTFQNNKERLFILNKIEKIVSAYYFKESKIFKYLGIKAKDKKSYEEIDFDLLKQEVENSNESVIEETCDKNATKDITNTELENTNNKESAENSPMTHSINLEYGKNCNSNTNEETKNINLTSAEDDKIVESMEVSGDDVEESAENCLKKIEIEENSNSLAEVDINEETVNPNLHTDKTNNGGESMHVKSHIDNSPVVDYTEIDNFIEIAPISQVETDINYCPDGENIEIKNGYLLKADTNSSPIAENTEAEAHFYNPPVAENIEIENCAILGSQTNYSPSAENIEINEYSIEIGETSQVEDYSVVAADTNVENGDTSKVEAALSNSSAAENIEIENGEILDADTIVDANKNTENNNNPSAAKNTEIENGEVSQAEADLNNFPIAENLDDDEKEAKSSPLPLNTFNFEETHLEKSSASKNLIPKIFKKNFLKCLYPSSFMDILTQNKYYCIPQVENYLEENSHKFSFDILRAIHKILTNSDEQFTIVGRGEGSTVEHFPQEKCNIKVPDLIEIEELTLQERRTFFFQILNLDNNFVSLLDHFPTEWHPLIISLKFASTKTTFQTPLIYSIILGFIILNYIDPKIGFYRSIDRYKQKYYAFMQSLPPINEHVPFRADRNCFYYFPRKDCTIFMQKIIYLFTANPHDEFDRHLLHQMSQIQSVLLHIKYLNTLLKNPYTNLIIHQIFNATFIYNLTKVFREKSLELENNYLNVFFKDCPSILAGLKYVLNMLSKQLLML
ncbi:unnamed protein product [Ceutorhynchus assimilis]|uniref:XPG N-terminal domain-containing protein n=1 Tax=Ceutorhynchus assimilis TaxID=467358 RepID=A0A9N9MPT9_9CUCU|nr:unnamed protein product [Ceutorhynchus assimilis]